MKNAFMDGALYGTIFLNGPEGFIDILCTHHVYLLEKKLYGIKQSAGVSINRLVQRLDVIV